MILFFLVQFITFCQGLLIVNLLRGSTLRINPLLHISLSWPIGAAFASLEMFLLLCLGLPTELWLLLPVDLICLFALSLIQIKSIKSRLLELQNYQGRKVKDLKPLELAALMSFMFLATIATAYFFLASFVEPHGVWDSWATWNGHAKTLFLGGKDWVNVAYPGGSNPSYPLLTPGFIMKCWRYVGAMSTSVPITTAYLFTISTVAVLMSALYSLRSFVVSLLAGMSLITTFWFVDLGRLQMADVPLAFYILASQAMICLYFTQNKSKRILFICGLLAACAGWTKSEGLLYNLAFTFVLVMYSLKDEGLKTSTKQLFYYALGMIPVLWAILYYRLAFSPSSEYFQGEGSVLSKVLDPQKALLALTKIAETFKVFFARALLPLVLLAFISKLKFKKFALIPIATAVLAWIGYFFIYMITPHDMVTQITITAWRLELQYYPALLLALFVLVDM